MTRAGEAAERAQGHAAPEAAEVAAHLEPWFVAAARDLPWRRTRDPYAIWVSEVMLQQTRVETVERYYDAFLRRFPTLDALAAADEDQVLEAWSGLGYYRRAKLLHRGARHLSGRDAARMPESVEGLREVPGIGRYTAGAIASIAFNRPEPLVDGNVARVSSRLRCVSEPKRQDAQAPEHWAFVGEILREGTPRLLSQALMELGATVCTPRRPRCDACPVETLCGARRSDLVDVIPAPKKRIEQPLSHRLALAIVAHDEELLLVRRPAQGLLADMWCLPLVTVKTPPTARVPQAAIERALGRKLAFERTPAGRVRHVFTHRIWELHCVRASVARKPRLRAAEGDEVDAWVDHRWIRRGQRPEGGTPSVTEKLLRTLGF